jgi:hypothetical protein
MKVIRVKMFSVRRTLSVAILGERYIGVIG